ncbi:MAG: hypothetical protein P8L31_00630, partial [Pseudomonadales bacterium]|nr:hypothetical protein [Pseudomonadales bacterium]
MQITRIYTGDDGRSHFEDVDIELEDLGTRGQISEPWPASSVMFRTVEGDYHLDFHTAPRRQLVVNLVGRVDIEIGDGTVRRMGAGSILLAEDTTGQGHISRAVAGEARQCLFIPLQDRE